MVEFIEPIFNLFKVKFDKMDELQVIDKDADLVVFYINLENVFTLLFQPRIDNQLRASGADQQKLQLAFISNIINLAQHYRLYSCCKGKNFDSRIILYWNYPRSNYKNRKYVTKYREHHDIKFFRNISCTYMVDALNDCHSLLRSTMKYVNEVYLLDGRKMECSLIPLLLARNHFSKEERQIQHIVVSKSVYDYQYLNLFKENFRVLVPAGEKSYILHETNVFDYLIKTTQAPVNVPIGQLPTLISLMGDTYRGIPKMNGVGPVGAVKLINKAIETLTIGCDTCSVELLRNVVDEPKREQFEKHYRATSLELQYQELTPLEIAEILSQIEDKCQDETLGELNETVFALFPLMIINSKTQQVRNSERFRYDITSIFR